MFFLLGRRKRGSVWMLEKRGSAGEALVWLLCSQSDNYSRDSLIGASVGIPQPLGAFCLGGCGMLRSNGGAALGILARHRTFGFEDAAHAGYG